MVVQLPNFCTTKLQSIKIRLRQYKTFVVVNSCIIVFSVVLERFYGVLLTLSRGSHESLKNRSLLANSCFVYVPFERRKLAFVSEKGAETKQRGWPMPAPVFQTFAPDAGRRPGNAQAPPAPSTIPSYYDSSS